MSVLIWIWAQAKCDRVEEFADGVTWLLALDRAGLPATAALLPKIFANIGRCVQTSSEFGFQSSQRVSALLPFVHSESQILVHKSSSRVAFQFFSLALESSSGRSDGPREFQLTMDVDGLPDFLSNDEDHTVFSGSSSQQAQCQRNMLLLAADSLATPGEPSVLMGSGVFATSDDDYLFGADELADLHGLAEVSVDSDDDDTHSDVSSQFGEVASYLSIFDLLSKAPEDRSSSDVDVVLEYIQHLPAFSNMSLSVRRKLCGVMTLETIRDVNAVVIRSGEEVDSWWVVFGGSVELTREGHEPVSYHLGECFGVARGAPKKKHIQTGTLCTRGSETILLRVLGEKFHSILSQLEEETIKVEEDGQVVLVTEFSEDFGTHIAVRGTPQKLLGQLLRDDEHPLFSEDFLLGYRTFMSNLDIATSLGEWFDSRVECREKVARTLLLWVTNHLDDFDGKEDMIAFLDTFQNQLQEANMYGEFRLLTISLQRRPTISVTREGLKTSPIPCRRMPIERDPVVAAESEAKVSPRTKRSFVLPFGKVKSKSTTSVRKVQSGRVISGPINSDAIIPSNSEMQVRPNNSSLSNSSEHLSAQEPGGSAPAPAITLRPAESSSGIVSSTANTLLSPTSPVAPLSDSGTVLKVYRHDHAFRYVVVASDTTADAVVKTVHKSFDMTDIVADYSLCRLSVSPEGFVKQTRLPGVYHNLPSHLSLTSRYYLKNNKTTTNLVHGEQVQEMLQEGATDLLSFDAKDIARAVTLQDFAIFCQISPVEYVEDLWGLPHSSQNDSLQRFSETTNREMFWVATEILKESVLTNRIRLIKHFIKIAKYCRKARNYNTMFAITSGLSYGAVTRLQSTWERVGSKHIKAVEEMQQLMNPSRNMFNYRHLVAGARSPMIPFFPVVKKDVTFMYLGNDNKVDGLINFEKLRMIAKEIRTFCNYHKNNYVPATMFGGQNNSHPGAPPVRPGKAVQYDQWITQRRVDHYLANLDVITDEDTLKSMAVQLEKEVQS